MAFFDELGKKAQAYAGVAVDKAKDLAGTASEKAKTAAETAKVNMAIMMEQRELDKNYKAIGEWFVSEYAEEIPEAVKDVVEAVNASKAKIAELEASKPQKEEPIAERSRQSAYAPCAAWPPTVSSAPSAAHPWASPRSKRHNQLKQKRAAPCAALFKA